MKVRIRESDFVLLPERAVYWPKHEVLFCSDLHWGREAYLQRMGFAVPERSFEKEAAILENALTKWRAKELWILGDFIHHPEGLHPELLGRMKRWLKTRTDETGLITRLIPGNHDRKFNQWASDLPIEVHPDGIVKDDFIFVHEPSDLGDEKNSRYCWSGHLHPAVYLNLIGSDKYPCFWIRKDQAFLPAFSRMSGGMEIGKQKPGDEVYAIADHQVIQV